MTVGTPNEQVAAMPRRKRCEGPVGTARGAGLAGLAGLHDDDSGGVDDAALDGDLDECGSPLGGASPHPHHPLQRNAANARERARMRVLSKAFCRLKTTLPWVPADTKLSKLDTLRLATSYIAYLRDVLLVPGDAAASASPAGPAGHAGHATQGCSSSGGALSLTWPFAFPQGGVHGVPGNPLAGCEPWISRGSASASSRASTASSRLPGAAAPPPGGVIPCSGSGLGSGASSNASSSSADDDPGAHDDEGRHNQDDGEEQTLSRRGLSGGYVVEVQQPCHYQPQAQYYLQRYVDCTVPGSAL